MAPNVPDVVEVGYVMVPPPNPATEAGTVAVVVAKVPFWVMFVAVGFGPLANGFVWAPAVVGCAIRVPSVMARQATKATKARADFCLMLSPLDVAQASTMCLASHETDVSVNNKRASV